MRPLNLTVRAAAPGERYDRLNEATYRQEVARVIESLPASFDRRYLNTGAADARYLQLTGGDLTGDLSVTGIISGKGVVDAGAQVFNIHHPDYDAPTDGVTPSDDAFAAVYAAIEANGGGWLDLGPYTYVLASGNLNPPSGTKHVGKGQDLTEIRDSATLGANRIFYIQGTQLEKRTGIRFTDLTIRNGSATTSAATHSKDGIRAEHVDGLSLERVRIHEIEGFFGLVCKYSSNIEVSNCTFNRWTYAAMTLLVECENVRVWGNLFDTAVGETSLQNYGFATGGEAGDATAAFLVRDVWVESNRFFNIPRWEAIDTKGGENIHILNNHIRNCKRGILASLSDADVSVQPILRNLHIKGNTIVQGTGQDHGQAIIVAGSNDRTLFAESVHVEGNECRGFGATSSINLGAIHVETARHVRVVGNRLEGWRQFAIMIFRSVHGWEVRNNWIGDKGEGSNSELSASAIVFRTVACVGGVIAENYLEPTSETGTPMYFLRANNAGPVGVQVLPNHVKAVANTIYAGLGNLPVEADSVPQGLILQKYGDVLLGTDGLPSFYVSAVDEVGGKIGMGSNDNTTVIVTASIEAGSREATVADASGTIEWLVPGVNISVAGAGPGGTDLKARVVSSDRVDTITLNVAADTTVSGANLTYQAATFSAA